MPWDDVRPLPDEIRSALDCVNVAATDARHAGDFLKANMLGSARVAIAKSFQALRAQLEAAEAAAACAEDHAREWKHHCETAEARAEAAEADAARWRAWRALDEHSASDIAWAYDAMGRDTAIDAAIARTKEETK